MMDNTKKSPEVQDEESLGRELGGLVDNAIDGILSHRHSEEVELLAQIEMEIERLATGVAKFFIIFKGDPQVLKRFRLIRRCSMGEKKVFDKMPRAKWAEIWESTLTAIIIKVYEQTNTENKSDSDSMFPEDDQTVSDQASSVLEEERK